MTVQASIRDIANFTAAHFQVPLEDMRSPTRARGVTWPRQCAYVICYELLDVSYAQIGLFFGGRDHTTVLSGIRAVQRRDRLNEKIFLQKARTFFAQREANEAAHVARAAEKLKGSKWLGQ